MDGSEFFLKIQINNELKQTYLLSNYVDCNDYNDLKFLNKPNFGQLISKPVIPRLLLSFYCNNLLLFFLIICCYYYFETNSMVTHLDHILMLFFWIKCCCNSCASYYVIVLLDHNIMLDYSFGSCPTVVPLDHTIMPSSS